MEKTYLEKKIEDIAEHKTRKAYGEFFKFMCENEFAKMLRVRVDGNMIKLASMYNKALFTTACEGNDNAIHTNLAEVYDEILKENEAKETRNILDKLNVISYLFEKE